MDERAPTTAIPILLITYNRPSTAKVVLERFAQWGLENILITVNQRSPHFSPRDALKWEENLSLVEGFAARHGWQVVLFEEHAGVHESIPRSISKFFEFYDFGIINEDDCLFEKEFLHYCAQAYQALKDDDRVVAVQGCSFASLYVEEIDQPYLSKIPHVWCWATTRKKWGLFEANRHQPATIFELFNIIGKTSYFLALYFRIMVSRFNPAARSWDYNWTKCVWRSRGYVIAPAINFVSNIGFGPEATFTKNADENYLRPAKNLSSAFSLNEEHEPRLDRIVARHHYGATLLGVVKLYLKFFFSYWFTRK